MSTIQVELDYVEAIADWFAELGEAHANLGQLEEALKCTDIASCALCRQNRTLSSVRVESNTLLVATRLPAGDSISWQKPSETVCLHVISEALLAGGLTAMVTRWIANDSSGCRHCLALLRQDTPIPSELERTVLDRGGEVYLADLASPLVARAVWLRRLAYQHASHVVLHVDVSDVICSTAFGVPGGPPVMLVNHAAHVFWTGASVVDLVLNCRGSVLEGVWASVHRGIQRYATLPIPLPAPPGSDADAVSAAKQKQEARMRLGIPGDAVVLLTVGAAFKYLPVGDLDFVRTCERVLAQVPASILLAVGFIGDDRWQSAARRTGNRIRTLGRLSQSELAGLHAAADVYLEGFPFGTTTSLLEAALRGLPVVLAPADCPPPYGSDGVALDQVLKRPTSVEEYAETVIRLARNPEDRQHEGREISRSVWEHHTGDGWRRHLEASIRSLPPVHAVHPLDPLQRTPPAIHEHWSRFLRQWSWGYEHTLENAVQQAYAWGLKPRLNLGMLKACRSASGIRKGRTIPLLLLMVLCNHLLIWLPAPIDRHLFRLASFVFRGSILARSFKRLACWLGLVKSARGAYDDYRQPGRPQERGAQP